MPECNSLGLALIGGGTLEQARDAILSGTAETVIVLENDLFRHMRPEHAEDFLATARHVVALDHLDNPTTTRADLVLPVGTFAEADGTLVNSEGRAQRFYQVITPQGEIQESWRWIRDAMNAMGWSGAEAWRNLDGISAALAEAQSEFLPILKIAPPADFRRAGQKIPRQPHRASGRTAISAHLGVSEPKPPGDPDTPLAFSMEGEYVGSDAPPPALIPFFWAPGWNSIQALNKFQEEVGGALRGGDPGARLIEPEAGARPEFFSAAAHAFKPRAGQWLIVPLEHIFGSEELSMHCLGVATLAPRPYLALNPEEAQKLAVGECEMLEVELQGAVLRLPLRLIASLPGGVAGMPAGLSALGEWALPAWGGLKKGERS